MKERLRALLFFVAAAVFFLVANFKAYRGYFQGDDLATLTWAIHGDLAPYFKWLLLPLFHPDNFRPAATLYYRILGPMFGLWYPPYVAAIQTIHLANVVVLYLILRRLQLGAVASAVGALFYLFNIATLEIYWKPMYVFDLLCASFCLLTMLLYIRGNWLFGILAFWLAYKSKELAVTLPLALAAYEYLLGQRRWKRLLPYFLIAANFGLQGVLLNPNKDNDYSLRFTWAAFASCLVFYATAEFFTPYAGLLLAMVPVLVRDRRIYFGLSILLALLFPMLLLPGRLASVYWYAALIGLSVMVAVLADKAPPWLAALCIVAWLAANIVADRPLKRTMLKTAAENRDYVEGIASLHRKHPETRVFGFDSGPQGLAAWGIDAAVHLYFDNSPQVYPAGSPEFRDAQTKLPSAVLDWNGEEHHLRTEFRKPQ